MFAELNELSTVILRADLFPLGDPGLWRQLAKEFSVVFVGDWGTRVPDEIQKTGATMLISRPAISAFLSTLIWEVLRGVQAHPFETVYVTADPEELAEAQSTRVGTVLLGRLEKTTKTAFPDVVAPTVTDLVKILVGYKNGKVSGYSAEVKSYVSGSHRFTPGTTSMWLFNDFLAGIPGQSAFVLAGRYFPSGDARHEKHPLTQRILRVKRGNQDKILETIFKDFMQCWKGIEELGLITTVPRRISGAPQPFTDLVRRACRELDKQISRRNGLESLLQLDVLYCTRPYRPQKEVGSYRDRQANVKGVFRAKKLYGAPGVLLVDDILASGSTALECSKALLSAGASFVTVFAFGLNQQVVIAPASTLDCTANDCPGHMKYRVNNTLYTGFWGCSEYPSCKTTLSFDDGIIAWNRKNRRMLIRHEPDVPF